MAYTFVQAAHGLTTGGGSPSATYGSATTAGNLLVAFAGGSVVGGSPVTAISMPSGWLDCGDGLQSDASGGTSSLGKLFYYPNNPGGITSVASTFTNNGNTSGFLHIFEFANAPSTVLIDAHSFVDTIGSNPSISTTVNHDLVFIALTSQATGGYGSDTGFSQDAFTFGGYGGEVVGEYILDASVASHASTIQNGSFLGVGFAVGFKLVANADTPEAISSTLTPSTTITEVVSHQEAISSQPTVSSSLLSDVVAHDPIASTLSPNTKFNLALVSALSTSTTPSTAFAKVYGQVVPISAQPTTSTSLGSIASRSTVFLTTLTSSTAFTSVNTAHRQLISALPAPTTSLGVIGLGKSITSSISVITSMVITRPKLMSTIPSSVSSTLREAATHPNFAIGTSITPITIMVGTRPAAIQTSTTPATSLAEQIVRRKSLVTAISASTTFAKVGGHVDAIATTLSPNTSIALFFVRSAAIASTLSPSTLIDKFLTKNASTFTTLNAQTKIAEAYGQVAATSTSVSPNSSLAIHRTYFGALTTSLTPSSSLTEAATHIYNPMRTTLGPNTSLVVSYLQKFRAITTSLTPSTVMTGPAQHLEAISSSLTPSHAFAKIPVYHANLKGGPLPSTRMTVQVSRPRSIRTFVTALTYFVNPNVTTYERTITERALFGGPLLQWLLCGPRVVTKGKPQVASCFG